MLRNNFPSYDYLKNPDVMQYYKNFEDLSIFESSVCAKCGMCCQMSGCMYFVEDFPSLKFLDLKKKLDEGNISIASRIDVEFRKKTAYAYPILYLRVRNQDRGIIDLLSPRTKCSLLTKDGCPYPFEERPLGAIMQLPTKNGEKFWDCQTNIEARIIAVEHWKKYQSVLAKLVKYYTNHSLTEELKLDIAKLVQLIGTKLSYSDVLSEEEKEFVRLFKYFSPEYYEKSKEDVNKLYLCLKASTFLK